MFCTAAGKGKSTKGKLKRSTGNPEEAAKKPRTSPSIPDPDSRRDSVDLASFTIPKRIDPFSHGAASSAIGQESISYFGAASQTYNKISSKTKIHCDSLLPVNMLCVDELASQMKNLLLDSKAPATWNKHHSAWNMYTSFCKKFNLLAWPATVENARAFATWSTYSSKLKAESAKSYISSLSVHNVLFNNISVPLNSDPVIKMILKGAATRDRCIPEKNKPKLSLNPHMLKVLGHRISECSWSDLSKQVLWTALLTCFFSSCRMGELVSNDEYSFEHRCTFIWKNISFLQNDGAVLFLPFTKTKGSKGDFVDLFFFDNPSYCPVRNLIELKNMLLKHGIYDENFPVFMFSSGKLLTKPIINQLLGKFLGDIFDSTNYKITCHSFRSSIPTLLSNLEGNIGAKEIKRWGRWESDSYTLYTKNIRLERKYIFSHIVSNLYNILK